MQKHPLWALKCPRVFYFLTLVTFFVLAQSYAQDRPDPDCDPLFQMVQPLSNPFINTVAPMSVFLNFNKDYESPLFQQARELQAFDDFKVLSDLQRRVSPVPMPTGNLKDQIFSLYHSDKELLPAPNHLTKPKESSNPVIAHIEKQWRTLTQQTPANSHGSLIPVPYPILIPGERFQEAYYWDSYFALKGLLATNRVELAAMQIENFLFLIENYGLVPNGLRTYYL